MKRQPQKTPPFNYDPKTRPHFSHDVEPYGNQWWQLEEAERIGWKNLHPDEKRYFVDVALRGGGPSGWQPKVREFVDTGVGKNLPWGSKGFQGASRVRDDALIDQILSYETEGKKEPEPWNPFNLPQVPPPAPFQPRPLPTTPGMGTYNPAPSGEDVRLAKEKEAAARGSQPPPPVEKKHARENVRSSTKQQLADIFSALDVPGSEQTEQQTASTQAGPSGTEDVPPKKPDHPAIIPGHLISVKQVNKTPEQDALRKLSAQQLEQIDFRTLTKPEQDQFIEMGLYQTDAKRAAVQKSIARSFPNVTFDWNLAKKYDTNTAQKGVAEFNSLMANTIANNPQLQPGGGGGSGLPANPQPYTNQQAADIINQMYGRTKELEKEEEESTSQSSEGNTAQDIAHEAKRLHTEEGQHAYPGPRISLPFSAYEGIGALDPSILIAMPDDMLKGRTGPSLIGDRDTLRAAEKAKLGMNDAAYKKYIDAREAELKSQWAYYRDMAPNSENKATAATVPTHDLGEPAQGAGIWERLWHGYHGTIAGIPNMLALGAGIALPSGTGNFKKDMEILRNLYTDAEIKQIRDYTRKAFDVFIRNTTPVEREDLGQLRQRLPDLFDTMLNEVPAPQIAANVPQLPQAPQVKGPRLPTGKFRGEEPQPVPATPPRTPPVTPLGGQLGGGLPAPRPAQAAGFGNIQLPPARFMVRDIANALQQGAQQGLAAAQRYGAEGLQILQQLAPESTATPTGGPSHLLGGPVPGAAATQLSPEMQYRARSPIATIEDVIEPDDIIDPSGPAQQGEDQRLHVPEQHEEDFYRWLSQENLIEELQLIYNRWASTQGFNVMPFDDWLKSDMGRSNLENFYDEFLSSQYPTYPEGREAYMRSAEYNVAHPEIMDIEEQLARNPARFPAPYRVGQLPPVAPYEEQLPPAPQAPQPMPFQMTQPTPGPLYPGGLGAVLEQAREEFRERTIPMIAERFAGVGGGINSSAFRGSLLEAGRRFERDLAALARERQLQEEQFDLQRAAQEARRVEEQNRLLAQREELGGRFGLQYGELEQRRAQLAREQQLAREREIQQRASQQQQLGIRGTELGGTLAERAARTEQSRVGLLAGTELAREQAQAAIANQFGGLGLQGAELGLRGQEAQARAQLGRGALLSGAQQEQAKLGMTQAQIREQLRQGQVGQQLQQYGIHRGLPATQGPAKVEGNLGTAMGVGGGVANVLGAVAPFVL